MKLIFQQETNYPYIVKGLVTNPEKRFARQIYVRLELYNKDYLVYKECLPLRKIPAFFPSRKKRMRFLNKAAWTPGSILLYTQMKESFAKNCPDLYCKAFIQKG